MALAGALCALVYAAVGFTNRSLCARVRSLLGDPYTSAQMTYDLRRLRLKGLVRRLPHSNIYVLTPDGARVAIFYTKVHNRLLGPLLAADEPPASIELRRALKVVDASIKLHRPRPAETCRMRLASIPKTVGTREAPDEADRRPIEKLAR